MRVPWWGCEKSLKKKLRVNIAIEICEPWAACGKESHVKLKSGYVLMREGCSVRVMIAPGDREIEEKVIFSKRGKAPLCATMLRGSAIIPSILEVTADYNGEGKNVKLKILLWN